AILCGGDGWHLEDLIRAAAHLGHTAERVDFRRVGAAVGAPVADAPGSPTLDQFDAIVVRTMPPGSLEQVVFRMDLLHALAGRGVPVLNPPRALEVCVDKYLALVRLQAAGLRVPETFVCQTADDALAAFDRLGRDVVVKPLFGSEGRGMLRVTDSELAWRSMRAIERTQSVLYVQRFIPHPGWDLRAFVLGSRVLAAMRRTAGDDWRTNVAQGATAEPVTLTPEQEALALRASEAVGTVAAGVDLLPGPGGEWYVIEVNAVPGWRALGPATGIDVAREMIQHITRHETRDTRHGVEDSCLVSRVSCLAAVWEATARKAGNVHRDADFADVTYTDFVTSAALAAPELARAAERPLGDTILAAIRATRSVVRTNTNLGIVLLLAPLAKAPAATDLRAGVAEVLNRTTVADAVRVYEAIRLAAPGGLGKAPEQDVRDAPTLPLRDVMALAADRDLVARQYANAFAGVFDLGVPALLDGLKQFGRVEPAVQHCQLAWLAVHPDSLIVRKRGPEVAADASRRAKAVLDVGSVGTAAGRTGYDELDRWLRSDGHARNPGTTADLVTACLYVALRQRTMTADTPL
ncbi:MAG TPA: RimK family alpha-L-glutamate ligase, partial [Gemmataceae bacterium]|nr:RimK family alpha-L-glutamate ligase [Gemmataceae bacterium]